MTSTTSVMPQPHAGQGHSAQLDAHRRFACSQDPAWWKQAVCYQIYPASFNDSGTGVEGKGYGDLRGITAKLDYLHDLGVDLVWLCPIYASPKVDMGYDISDYDAIDPLYGSMDDWQELVDGLHARKMRLIMDLVVNHSSDQHAWFVESKKSKNSAKRDYYIWRPAKYDAEGKRRPPNNWASIWGGSAWECSQEYYLHIFSPQQPDLNFEHPALVTEIKEMMTRWLERGIDGFRLDAINFVSKPTTHDWPDAPITDPGQTYQSAFSIFNHGPRVHDILKELYTDVLSHYDAFTVGEAAHTSPEQAIGYVRQDRDDKELRMVFHTEHIDLYSGFSFDPPTDKVFIEFKATIAKWQTKLMENASWQSLYDSNHDHPRPINNILAASVEDRYTAATLLAVFLNSLAGTVFLYQGEEIGMMNVPLDWPIENYQDLVSKAFYDEQYQQRRGKLSKGDEPDMTDVMAAIQRKARDNARTPMPWDSSELAGFTKTKPWMPVNPDNKLCNVADQLADPSSILHFWRRMIFLRKSTPALVYGSFKEVDCSGDDIFCYTRTLDSTLFLVLLNFGKTEATIDGGALASLKRASELLVGNYDDASQAKETLRRYEARVYKL